MNKLTNKIIKTFLLCSVMLVIVSLSYSFVIGLINYDDDIMFISALCLVVITCFVVMVEIISTYIAKLWVNKKDNKEQKKWKSILNTQTQ